MQNSFLPVKNQLNGYSTGASGSKRLSSTTQNYFSQKVLTNDSEAK